MNTMSHKKEEKKENNFIYDALFKIAPIMYVIAFLLINMFVWRLFEPDWNHVESIYFICASLTTVGYGDRVPSSSVGCIVLFLLSITTVFPIISDGMDKALTWLELAITGEDTNGENSATIPQDTVLLVGYLPAIIAGLLLWL